MMDVREKLVELIFDSINLNTHTHRACNLSTAVADDLIAHGVTVQEWISVKDRLPEERAGWGFTYSDVVIVAGKRHDGSLYVSQDTTTDGKWNTTHPLYWMPMPQPPKGEQE